jgi:hypothetical protein
MGVIHAYYAGDTAMALRLLAKLRQEASDPAEYDLTPEEFALKNIGEILADASVSKVVRVLTDWTGQAYLYLALGDDARYRQQKRLAESYYHGYALRRWPQAAPTQRGADASWQEHIPPLESVRANVAMGILADMDGLPSLTPPMKMRLVAQLRQQEPEIWNIVEQQAAAMRQQAEEALRAPLAP